MTGQRRNGEQARTLIRDDRAALALAIADLDDLLEELPAIDAAPDAETREVRVAWERFLRAWSRALEVRLRAAAAGEPAAC